MLTPERHVQPWGGDRCGDDASLKEALRQIVAPQPVGQLGGVLHIVFDPSGVPMQTERMHQMHPGTFRLQKIGGPIPAIRALQRHLRIRSGLGHRHGQSHRVIVDLLIRTITDRRRCRSIPTYCCCCTRSPPLLRGFGFAPPSVIPLGLPSEEDFRVPLPLDLPTPCLPSLSWRRRTTGSLSRNAASASS